MPKSHAFLGNHGASYVIIGCISQLFPGQDCNYHLTPNRPVFINDAPLLSELRLLYINNWVGKRAFLLNTDHPTARATTSLVTAPGGLRGEARHLCSTFGQIHASRRLVGVQAPSACLLVLILTGLAQTLPPERLHTDPECQGPNLDLPFPLSPM